MKSLSCKKTYIAEVMGHIHVIFERVLQSWILVELVEHTLRTENSNVATRHRLLVNFGRFGRTVFLDFAKNLQNYLKAFAKNLLIFEVVP
jgi:hypothetical protein